MSEPAGIGGWICRCKGRILDPRRPAETMICCKNYEWYGKGEPTLPHPRDRNISV